MSQEILHFSILENASLIIRCGKKFGTTFVVVAEGNSRLLLTAAHNIEDGEPIYLVVNYEDVEAAVVKIDEDHDIAILSVELKEEILSQAVPLQAADLATNEQWETFGFPKDRVDDGIRLSGHISRRTALTRKDLDLECDQYGNLDFEGLSGAPLLVNGFVTGVLVYDNVGTIGATSIVAVAELLVAHGIPVGKVDIDQIPESLEHDIEHLEPNENVIEKIHTAIEHARGHYFLLSGSPGSGKTTLAAQLEPAFANQVIADRFFVKVADSERVPTHVRVTAEFFIKWLEGLCYRILYNQSTPKPPDKQSMPERIQKLHQLLVLLSKHYKRNEKSGFLVIDGLDDVSRDKIDDYLSVLPDKLPSHINILFSCTSRQILPIRLQAAIDEKAEVKVTPLSIRHAERYLRQELADKDLSELQIHRLAERSEGHPLYLRYLAKYAAAMEDIPTLDGWIENIPSIHGEIRNYYDKIWLQISDNADDTWLAGTLSRLRVPVSKKEVQGLLPQSTRHNFPANFKKINHLLRNDELLSIYHTSFSDFVNDKTEEQSEQIHNNIADYAEAHAKTGFGISQRVYHLAHGDESHRQQAIKECTQAWADQCALQSVNPDAVLADLKLVIALAAERGITHQVIALLLLSQRVSFRYNTLFDYNSVLLVDALLALGKPAEAIRYVVRNKALTTSDSQALYLLQKIYEYGAKAEARQLLDVIEQTCNNIAAQEMDGAAFDRFVNLRFGGLTLSYNEDLQRGIELFYGTKKNVERFLQENGNPDNVIEQVKDRIATFNIGYCIWRFKIPSYVEQFESDAPHLLNDKLSGQMALSISQALDFAEISPSGKTDLDISSWIKSLEYVIDTYGVHPDYRFQVLITLQRNSERIDLIEQLYKLEFPVPQAFLLRKDNGVDLNTVEIRKSSCFAECQALLDTSDQVLPLPVPGFSISDWENDLKKVFEYIAFLNGKVRRYQIDGKTAELNALRPQVEQLMKNLCPHFYIRIKWERAYGLPEAFYPAVYVRLLHLLTNAFPDLIAGFTQLIASKKSYQLGLYTEGYIGSLFVIASELATCAGQQVPAFQVMKTLEEQVLATVENRWQRTEYLLRLVTLYALIGNKARADYVFKEMIATSMGPSWYKEDQLGIINTAVNHIIPANGEIHYLQKFAAHLHRASGEMTFQRYVKYQQEEFLGDLAGVGFLEKAIQYCKYLLLPEYKTVLNNAESGLVDMEIPGQGYVLGARAIDEQHSILELLNKIQCNDSLVTWALCELWILGDDRYLSDYAKLQAGIISATQANEPQRLNALLQRLVRFAIAEVSHSYRRQYLEAIFNHLSPQLRQEAAVYLSAAGLHSPVVAEEAVTEIVRPDREISESEKYLDSLVEVKRAAEQQLMMENKPEARKIIIGALEELQRRQYPAWMTNYYQSIDQLRSLLSETYNEAGELIKDLKSLIINEPNINEWLIADHIIELLKHISDEEEKQHILSSVLEHIDLMVRTPQNVFNQYTWIGESALKNPVSQYNAHLLKLLIWFLNHPSLVVKNRTIELLTWLGCVDTLFVIEALFHEIVEDKYAISRELSAAVIHQISLLNPTGFAAAFHVVISNYEKQVVALEHFMIRESLLASLEHLRDQGETLFDTLITQFEQSFASANRSKGEVDLEEPYLENIQEHIHNFNEMGILTKEFAHTLLIQIQKYAAIPVDDAVRASKYISRSFNNYNDVSLVPDFDTVLRYALNVAVYPCVIKEDRAAVADILRFYQPTFPENHLATVLDPGVERFEQMMDALTQETALTFDELQLDDLIPLQLCAVSHNKSGNFSIDVDLTAYLIPLATYNGTKYSYPMPYLTANQYPFAVAAEEEYSPFPMIIKGTGGGGVTGSELVPGVINPALESVSPGITSLAKTIYWRQGRNWDISKQGVAEKSGYFTTIDRQQTDSLKNGYRLILKVYGRHQVKYIDVFDRKIIANVSTK